MTWPKVPNGSYLHHFGLSEGQPFIIDARIEIVFVSSSPDARVAKLRARYYEPDWRGAVVSSCDAYLRAGDRFHVEPGVWCEVMHNRGDMVRVGIALPKSIRQVLRRQVMEALARTSATVD